MPENPDWSGFYERTKENPPSELLIEALKFVQHKEKAIDIGGGALKDSRYLLKAGFDVTDLDQEELKPEYSKDLDPKTFHHVAMTFAEFDFPTEEYDIANAMYSLPFTSPETFNQILQNIKKSLHPGGILSGNFFGDRDKWNGDAGMTFHTLEQTKQLLEDMEVLSFEEKEWDAKTAGGEFKHWHVFEFIAKKIG